MANVVLERQTEQRGGILKGCTRFSGFPEEEKLDRATWNREMGEEATTQYRQGVVGTICSPRDVLHKPSRLLRSRLLGRQDRHRLLVSDAQASDLEDQPGRGNVCHRLGRCCYKEFCSDCQFVGGACVWS